MSQSATQLLPNIMAYHSEAPMLNCRSVGWG